MGKEDNNGFPHAALEMLKALHVFAFGHEDEVETMSIEQVKEALKAEGLNTDNLLKRLHQKFDKVKATEQLDQARMKREELLRQIALKANKVGKQAALLREELLRRIQELGLKRPEVASTYFRKFEQSSDEDLSALLEDIRFLEEMDNGNDQH